MASATNFSTSGEDVISRTVDLQPEETPAPGTAFFADFYEIARTVQQIEEGDFRRVSLMTPLLWK